MRCSCHNCGTYMVHSESRQLGCVCPDCGNRCKACLGTDTVISKEDLKNLPDIDFTSLFSASQSKKDDEIYTPPQSYEDEYSD